MARGQRNASRAGGRRTVAEYFAGIGLMRMGLDEAGWETVFANDIDRKKQEMYCHHFGPSPEFVLGDIHALRPENIPITDLATASFPCNDLSLAGARAGLGGTHSSAFWGFIKILNAMGSRRPRLVMLENVAGFLTSNGGADLALALRALNDAGYAVDAFIIDASAFVPQSRVRMFIVGTQTGGTQGLAEPESFFQSALRPKALADFIFEHPDLRWDIRPLPALPTATLSLCDIVEDLPESSSLWWSRPRCEYLLNQMSPRHRQTAEEMMKKPGRSFATVFRRVRSGRSMAELRTDGVAGCLRTPRGGSGRQILFVAGGGTFAVRLLSGRECARLMGAADFTLKVPLNQALFGFGDAVCVPVVRWIAENYLNPALAELRSGGSNQPAFPIPTKVRYGT